MSHHGLCVGAVLTLHRCRGRNADGRAGSSRELHLHVSPWTVLRGGIDTCGVALVFVQTLDLALFRSTNKPDPGPHHAANACCLSHIYCDAGIGTCGAAQTPRQAAVATARTAGRRRKTCTTPTLGLAMRGTGRQALQGLMPAVRARQTPVCQTDAKRAKLLMLLLRFAFGFRPELPCGYY